MCFLYLPKTLPVFVDVQPTVSAARHGLQMARALGQALIPEHFKRVANHWNRKTIRGIGNQYIYIYIFIYILYIYIHTKFREYWRDYWLLETYWNPNHWRKNIDMINDIDKWKSMIYIPLSELRILESKRGLHWWLETHGNLLGFKNAIIRRSRGQLHWDARKRDSSVSTSVDDVDVHRWWHYVIHSLDVIWVSRFEIHCEFNNMIL